MELRIKVRELFDRDLWDDYCEITGTNPWCINEGLLDKEDYVEIEGLENIKKLGLLDD